MNSKNSWYEFMDSTHTCGRCNWTGKGSEAATGETFRDGQEFHCPGCEGRFGYIAYPMIEETLSDPRASEVDQLAAKVIVESQNLVSEQCLKAADELPELAPGPEKLVWDVHYNEGFLQDRLVIQHGDRVIWEEMSLFEEYHRFGEIAVILWEKYGSTLRDLEPTKQSWLNLGGDALGSIGYIERIRQALARGENPAGNIQ